MAVRNPLRVRISPRPAAHSGPLRCAIELRVLGLVHVHSVSTEFAHEAPLPHSTNLPSPGWRDVYGTPT